MKCLILLCATFSIAGCATETRTIRLLPVVDPDLLTICPGDDRDVATVRDLALRDIANRTAVDCANGKIVTIGVTLSRAAEIKDTP